MVMESTTEIAVRYAETDRMGVVHHSVYPVYFEAGRTDFFVEHLYHYHQMEQQGLFAAVVSYQVEILGAVTYGDTLSLVTRPDWLKGVRLQMSYEIRRQCGARVVRGSTLHALLGQGLKPVHPRAFPEIYQRLREVFP